MKEQEKPGPVGRQPLPADATARRLLAARLSLISNFLLGAFKLAVGATTGSVAILSDGVNSACDLVATGAAYFAVARSGRPPDPQHPWGYGKYESLAGIVEALAIFAAGAYVVVQAIQDLRHGRAAAVGALGFTTMAVSLVLNILLSTRVLKIARETDSIALQAEGQHIRTDVMTSGGVLTALLASRYLDIPHIQPAAAIMVSFMIFRASYQVAVMALSPLLDYALPRDETQAIQAVLRSDPEVQGWHNLRTRRSGATRHVDVHVMLPDDLTFVEAHRHSEALEKEIARSLGGQTDVIIHAEPFLDESQHQEEHHGRVERPQGSSQDGKSEWKVGT